MHVLIFMRKVDSLDSATEIILKHVCRASRRRSWRKLNKFKIRFTLFAIICICGTYILEPTANWSPYIFTLVQKVKHRVYKIHVF